MARTRRIKLAGRDAIYHIMSRTAGRQMLLADAGVKRDMLRALERSAEFSGVEVLGFALMDNHFHLVVRIPSPEGPVPEKEVLRRYAVLVGKEKAGELESRLAHMRERGDSHSVDVILDRMRSRMYDLSQFGKTFKETFGRIFRKKRPWCGNLWEGRFKSTLIGEAEYLRICTAYVELNPVRAGLSTSSSGYEWCTTGAAERGNAFAQRCRERLAAVAGFGDSPRSEGWLMKRAPQISCGKIFGSGEFVAESLGLLADKVKSRTARPRRIKGGEGFSSHGHLLAAKIERKAA